MKVFFLVTLLLWICSTDLIAKEKKFGIQFGINYFRKIQQIKYTPVDENNRNKGGKLLFDSNGHSFQFGIVYSITNYFSLVSEYRFPRKCSYSYPSVWTPWVWGPNTYWVKTESSSWRLGGRFRFHKLLFTRPYLGIGYELVRLRAWSRSGHIRGDTGEVLYISPDPGHYHGFNLNGFFISADIQSNIYNNLFVNFSCSYIFTKLNLKQKEFQIIRYANQNLSGFYIRLDLILMIF